LAEIVEFGAGVGRGQRGLDRVEVELFRVFDGLADGLPGFARQPHDKCAVDRNTQLFAIPGELDGLLFGDPLPDIPEDLFVARFVADHDMAQAGLAHDLEGLVVAVGAGIDGPGEPQRLDQAGYRPGVFFIGRERVIVEGELAHLGDVVLDPLDFLVNVLRTASAHFPTGNGLGPEAVDAAGGAAAAGIDRDIRVLEVRYYVFLDRQVAFVDRRHKGECIQILDHGAIGGVDNPSVLDKADAVNL